MSTYLAKTKRNKQPMQVVSGAQEVTLPSGVRYTDLKIGGGSPVQKGYLMVLDFKYVCTTHTQYTHTQ